MSDLQIIRNVLVDTVATCRSETEETFVLDALNRVNSLLRSPVE